MKIKPSEAKKIKSTLDRIGLGEFWTLYELDRNCRHNKTEAYI